MIFYADFETPTTLDENDSVSIYLWGLISQDGFIREYNIDMESFISYLENQQNKPIIYFHNLSWDGNFIVHWLVDNNFEFIQQENFIKKLEPNQFTWIADENTSLYKLKVQTEKQELLFLDSYKLLMNSVKKLGEAINLPKLKINYEIYKHFESKDELPNELVEYLYRDIDIVREFMMSLQDKVPKMKTTLASTTYNMFMKFYGRDNFIRDFGNNHNISPLTIDEWDFVKKSYRGGLTLTSPLWNEKLVILKGQQLGYSYDVNSLYPYVMETYRLPYGQPKSEKTKLTDIELKEIRIIKAKIKSEFLPATLPNNDKGFYKGTYLREVEDITFTVWSDELEVLLKYYDIEYIEVKSMWFNTKYIFREFIQELKEMKINAKNGVIRLIAKLLQNALYGKYGENRVKLSKILIKDDKKILKGKRYGTKQEWVEKLLNIEQKGLSYIPLASYITALARCKLMNAIYNNQKNFLYCDTDSIYLKDKAIGIEIDDKLYGYWKQEHTFKKFKSLKPKCYMLQDELTKEYVIKVAGLPDDAKNKLNFSTFYIGSVIENGKLQKKSVKGGLILKNIIYTL